MSRHKNGIHVKGWRPQRADHRDIVYKNPSFLKLFALPKKLDLRNAWVTIEDQRTLGSCVANAATSCLEFLWKKHGRMVPSLSRLFVYYSTRVWIEGIDPSEDSGLYIRDAIKSLVKYGVCRESVLPYQVDRFSEAPSQHAIVDAEKHQLLTRGCDGKPGYFALHSIGAIKACIAEGYPAIGGFSVTESTMSDDVASSGVIPLPRHDEAIIGGHCVAFVGYDDAKKRLMIANSWGRSWGEMGFGYLPYDYVTRGLADDFWTMRNIEGA